MLRAVVSLLSRQISSSLETLGIEMTTTTGQCASAEIFLFGFILLHPFLVQELIGERVILEQAQRKISAEATGVERVASQKRTDGGHFSWNTALHLPSFFEIPQEPLQCSLRASISPEPPAQN